MSYRAFLAAWVLFMAAVMGNTAFETYLKHVERMAHCAQESK